MEQIKNTFISSAERLQTLASSLGKDVKVYSNTSLNNFLNLGKLKQEEILFNLQAFSKAIERTKKELNLESSADIIPLNRKVQRDLTRFSLWELGLSAPDDFLNKIGDEDVIEVYDKSIVQIYRNMKMALLSEYDLVDLMMYPFQELFSRDQDLNSEIFTQFNKALTENRTLQWDLPEHDLIESKTKEGRIFRILFKYVAPVSSLKTGEIVGGITCESVKRIRDN